MKQEIIRHYLKAHYGYYHIPFNAKRIYKLNAGKLSEKYFKVENSSLNVSNWFKFTFEFTIIVSMACWIRLLSAKKSNVLLLRC